MPASAKLIGSRISLYSSSLLCNQLRGMKLVKAEKFLQDLIERRASLRGKYYTKTAKHFLQLLKSVEANARRKNLELERLRIRVIKADKGQSVVLPKTRAKLGRRKAKSTNVSVVVG